MSYEINERSHERAKEMGLQLKPSTQKLKKVDVFKNEEYLFSIGDMRQKDYYEVLKEEGAVKAGELRTKYRKLHKYDKDFDKIVLHRCLY